MTILSLIRRTLILSRFTGRSSEMTNMAKDFEYIEEVPFCLTDGAEVEFFVTEPCTAKFLSDELTTIREKYKEEQILPIGTTLLGFGKIRAFGYGKHQIEAPPNSEDVYILTRMTKDELIGSFENKIWWVKVSTCVTLLVGGGITIYLIYKLFKRSKPMTSEERIVDSEECE